MRRKPPSRSIFYPSSSSCPRLAMLVVSLGMWTCGTVVHSGQHLVFAILAREEDGSPPLDVDHADPSPKRTVP
ncbi:hypothetical protein GUJ93_ZPchr0004g39378 [Zizania palustris]|uniref:Uncharacterized protein n=1 Tax=Zizania palustris TaxID=103762 RepID=A0A8J5S5X9_ZIZPA|nr:hypothetical protein GUJ93_ZPchr0004g39378 [Zizania palustris]